MLLLLLSLFSINCRQAVKATDYQTPLSQLMHKSILDIDSLLNDFQQEIRKEQSVLQAVDQDIQDAGHPGYSLTPRANHIRNSGNDTPPTLFPYPPGHLPTTTIDPWNAWKLPGLDYPSTPNPFSYFMSHQHSSNYSLKPTTPFNYTAWIVTRPTYPSQRPVGSPRTEHPGLQPIVKNISTTNRWPGFPVFTLPTKDLLSSGLLRSVTARAKARTVLKFFSISDLQRVERERSWYRPLGQRLTKANRMRATTARRPQPQLRKSTLSKAQAWVQNRQWTKNKAGRTQQRHLRQGTDNPSTVSTATEIPVGNPSTMPTPKEIPVGNPSTMPTPKEIPVGNPSTMPTPKEIPVDNTLSKQTPIAVDKQTTPISVNNTLNTTTSLPGGHTESDESFSVPGLLDMIPSMSLPGLDEVSLAVEATVSDTPTTTFNQLDVTVTMNPFTEELIKEDDAGFLFVSSPAYIPEPTTESTANTLGLVLENAELFTASTLELTPHQVLHGLMETMEEGYLPVFLLELARLASEKPPEHVFEVFQHFEIIFNRMYEANTLAHFDEPILELGTKVSRMFSETDIGTLRIHANMMNDMLKERKKYISVEVNSIIDYADMLFEDDEGEELFDALSAFYNFPNVTISGHDVCYNMITSFIKPYKRLHGTDRLHKLTDTVLKVVATKFGNRRRGDTATMEQNQTINKTKRNPSSLRQRTEIKRLQMRRRQQEENLLVVRDMLPITKHQKRFRVNIPKQLRNNGYMGMLRPTQAYFQRKLGRPVRPQGAVLSLFPEFPQARDVEFKSRALPAEEEPHHPKEPATQPKPAAMREEVRRIFEESSYSDEEASLKMNLRHALRVNWRRTRPPTAKTSGAVAKY